jgi:16S rRNA (cytosine967-C5)-methyltransferase
LQQKNNTVTDLPEWAQWKPEIGDLSARHSVRILRSAAALELQLVKADGRSPPLDRALQNYQRTHRKMGRNDRLLLGTAVYHLARNRELLLEAGREFIPGEGDLLLLALTDALGSQDDLGTIRHLPGGVRPWRQHLARLHRRREELVGTVARAFGTPLADAAGTEIVAALSNLFSIPEWWFTFGPWSTIDQAVAELARLRTPQTLTLRVSAHRGISRGDVMDTLSAQGIPCAATPRSPWGIVVEGRHNVLATELYRAGTVEVQDEGSQLVAALIDPKPSECVLDLCAGGGGKALALAAAMGARGQVITYDINPRKLEDVRRRARRAGLGNVRVAESPAEVDALGPYDQVLADVPCTSTGTLRRNPDVAWRWGREALQELTATQASILDRAAQLVRPGGHLVYATCSLLEIENGSQMDAFLRRFPDFSPAPPGDRQGHGPLLDLKEAVPRGFRLPADLDRYTGDAFFMARFRRGSG